MLEDHKDPREIERFLHRIIPISEPYPSKAETLSLLKEEGALDALVDCIISLPLHQKDPTLQKKRSLRAMQILVEDSSAAYELHSSTTNHHALHDDMYKDLILNPTNAGLMAKKIFSSYRQLASFQPNVTEHVYLLNKLLGAILHAFPSSIVGAACAGGKDGIELSLQSMLTVHSIYPDECSPLPLVTKMVVVGCTGQPYEPYRESPAPTAQAQPANSDVCWMTKGHRRKFVRAFIDSNFLKLVLDGLTKEVDIVDDSQALKMESLCDSLIAMIDCIAHTKKTSTGGHGGKSEGMEESVGEESLLSYVCQSEVIQRLLRAAGASNHYSSCAARLLLALYESAAGISGKYNKCATASDGSEDDGAVNAKAVKESSASEEMNKFIRYGLTKKLHASIVSHMGLFIQAVDVNSLPNEIEGSDDGCGHIVSSVKHPGGYIVQRPFTSRRLNLITLLAHVLFFEASSNIVLYDSFKTLGMDALMSLPPSQDENNNLPMNPWPGLCILLFDYPENNMFQNQFYRLLLALCLSNHEPSLKMVVQKSKFISRSLSVFQNPNRKASVRGVLIRCLNALRLASQTLSPQSFLRHFLESHDHWKLFQTELTRLTTEQVIPGGGFSVPSTVTSCSDHLNLDLGSAFAVELGFPITKQRFVEEPDDICQDATPKGDKKKKKKKKKKSVDASHDGELDE